jgi:structural maintenance of chromosome 1
MDGISFGLALNAKDLRSSRLKDLIHRPPGCNPKENKLSASVTLSLIKDATDIRDQTALERSSADTGGDDDSDLSDSSPVPADPLTAIDLKSKSLEFKRTIQASGVSVYYLNGDVVSHKEYIDALASIGFPSGNHNFLVFQGAVEALAQKSPEQLGALIDHCSGSADMKAEYLEKLRAEQEAEACLVNTRKEYALLNQELMSLRAQENATKKLQKYQEELNRLKADGIMAQLFSLENPLKDGEDELSRLVTEQESKRRMDEKARSALQHGKSDASKARRSLEKTDKARGSEETKLKLLEEDLKVLCTKIDTFEHGLAKQEKKLTEEKNSAEKHDTDLQDLMVEIQTVKSEMDNVETEFTQALQIAAAGSNQVVLSRQQEEQYQALKEVAAASSTSARQTVQGIEGKIDSIRVNMAPLRGELEDIRTKRQLTSEELKDYQDRASKLSLNIKDTQKKIQITEAELKNKREESKRVEQRRQELELEIEQVKARISEVGDARHKSRDEEDLKSVVKTLQQEFSRDKVYGRLVDLCHPTQRRYALAITCAAGKTMDGIVTNSKDTAARCIQFLREQRLGVATFLPLDLIRKPSPETLQRMRARVAKDGTYRLAIDVITCDSAFQNAVLHAVGTCVVCEDLGAARSLCFGNRSIGNSEEQSVKAVTIDGHVISKSGTMTGGVTNENVNQAGRWNDKEMEDLLHKKETLEAEKNALFPVRQSELTGMENVIGTETNKKSVAALNLMTLKGELTSKKVYLASLSQKTKELETASSKWQKELHSLQGLLSDAKAKVAAIEDEHLGPFLIETGLKDVRAYEQATRETREEFNKKKRDLMDHLSRLEEKKKCMYEKKPQMKIKMIESRLASRKKELAEARERKGQLETKAEVAGQRLADAELAFEEAKERETKCDEIVKALQKDLETSLKETSKVNKKVTALTSRLAELRGKRHDILQDAHRHQILLPTVAQTTKTSDGTEGDNRDEDMAQADDGSDDDEITESSQQTRHTNPTATQYSQSDDMKVVADNRVFATLDFSEVDSTLKKRLLDGQLDRVLEEFSKRECQLQKDIADIVPSKKVRQECAFPSSQSDW